MENCKDWNSELGDLCKEIQDWVMVAENSTMAPPGYMPKPELPDMGFNVPFWAYCLAGLLFGLLMIAAISCCFLRRTKKLTVVCCTSMKIQQPHSSDDSVV